MTALDLLFALTQALIIAKLLHLLVRHFVFKWR